MSGFVVSSIPMLEGLYHQLVDDRERGQGESRGRLRRLEYARSPQAVDELASAFDSTVAALEQFDNRREPFQGQGRGSLTAGLPDALLRTPDVSRCFAQVGGLALDDVGTFDYRGRELFALRMTAAARPRPVRPVTQGLIVDVLLAAPDGAPVVGEVKIRTDKDPVAALVQALAGAAELAPRNQRVRLERHYGVRADGAMELCLILAEFPATATYMNDLSGAAQELAAVLLTRPIIRQHVRRISCVDMRLTGVGGSPFETRLLWTEALR